MSQEKALVSVIVPVYNAAAVLEENLKSIVSQDYPNIEIILVDDGSKDDSFKICQELAARNGKIRVYHTENRGSGPARNYGIDHAVGKYAYFPDADDLVDVHCISTAVNAMNGGQFDLVVFGFCTLDRNGEVLSKQEYPSFSKTGDEVRMDYSDYVSAADSCYAIQGAPWNKLFDLDLIRAHQIRFPDMRRHQDEAFIARYMCWAQNVCFVNKNLYTYYANDLRKVWAKYPVEYADIVYQLRANREQTILTWNAKDTRTHEMLDKEYLWGILTACEIQFSPKAALRGRARKKKICSLIEQSKVCNLAIPDGLSRYRKSILWLARKHCWNAVYVLMWIKVHLEITGAVDKIKRWKK